MSGVAALILAAGRGTRFGTAPKLLAPLEGRPLVRHAVDAVLASRLRPVLVVTGQRHAEVEVAVADPRTAIVFNPAFADGLSTSLRAGFAALPEGVEAVAVLLGDMPRIGPTLLDELAAAWEAAGRPDALVPTFAGRRGNPVVVSRGLGPEIARLVGDVGAGPLLKGRRAVVEYPVNDDAVVADVDTEQGLAALAGQAPASTTPSRIAE